MVMREGTWADEYHLIVRTRAAQQAHARTLYERLGFHAGTRTDKRSQLFESGAGRQYLRVDAAKLKASLQAVIDSTHGENAHGWTWRHAPEGGGLQGDMRNWVRALYELIHARVNKGDGRGWETHPQDAAHIRGTWSLASAAVQHDAWHGGDEDGTSGGDRAEGRQAPVVGQGDGNDDDASGDDEAGATPVHAAHHSEQHGGSGVTTDARATTTRRADAHGVNADDAVQVRTGGMPTRDVSAAAAAAAAVSMSTTQPPQQQEKRTHEESGAPGSATAELGHASVTYEQPGARKRERDALHAQKVPARAKAAPAASSSDADTHTRNVRPCTRAPETVAEEERRTERGATDRPARDEQQRARAAPSEPGEGELHAPENLDVPSRGLDDEIGDAERAAAAAMAAAIAAENEFYNMTAEAEHSDEDEGEPPERATPRKRRHCTAEESDEQEREAKRRS